MISDNNLFGMSCLLPRDEPAFSDQPLPSPKKQTLLSALQTCVSFLKIEYRFFKMHSHYEKKSLGLWVIKHKKHATVECPSLALCAEPAVVSARGVITCPWWTHAARCQQIFKSQIFGLCYFLCPQKTFRQRCCIFFFKLFFPHTKLNPRAKAYVSRLCAGLCQASTFYTTPCLWRWQTGPW